MSRHDPLSEPTSKTILITGAYGGMGRAAVSHFSSLGWRVFALDLYVGEGAENVIPVAADITDEDSVQSAFHEVKGHTDTLSAILHFAGIYMLDSMVEMENDAFRRIFDVNVRGAFLVNKTFLPMLRTGGRILMTTSELAPLYPLPFTGIYGVTKSALDRYAFPSAWNFSSSASAFLSFVQVRWRRECLGYPWRLSIALRKKQTSCNAARFRQIVERVEARCVPPHRIAKKCASILDKRNPKFAYSINRNPLLLFMNLLPKRMQLWAIRMILK